MSGLRQQNPSRLSRRITAYFLLFFQLFIPVFSVIPATLQATENTVISHEAEDTFSGLNMLMGGDPVSPSVSIIPVAEPSAQTHLPTPDNTVRRDDIFSALPVLGSADGDGSATPETTLAQGLSQAGTLLSAEDKLAASAGYARSLGENLVNQQINDWLNQSAHARVQLSTEGIGEADILLPIADNPNSLFFGQVGLRAGDERTTSNVGLGYRQFSEKSMWGLNSFYDYDIDGGNARLGFGAEYGADYLKLAANSYFRLTNWHASSLRDMRDYDERPANGFDVRAEGYLPSDPRLGAFARYEQYFGEGISLSNGQASGSDLKKNPSKSTLGLSYTPFPLITLKGETSRGDSHDSLLGLELSYRFGVPLFQQLNSESVAVMRSVAGNRYDFVSRNYNIVMQYRKQELLTISLPESMKAEAANTLPVTVTVSKAKYGLKSVEWSAPELVARGGTLRVLTPVTVSVTLPPYDFGNRSVDAQGYRLSAIGTDNEGNISNTAVTQINVVPSSDIISDLILTPDTPRIADNRDTYMATALVRDQNGIALPDKSVTFSVSGFRDNSRVTLAGTEGQPVTVMTDSNGQAAVTVKSKIAGKGTLTAMMENGNRTQTDLVFYADSSTAKISTLTLMKNHAVADGKDTNTAVTTVQDQFGNPVADFLLTSSVTNDAVVVTPSQSTDEQGQITTEFNSIIAGDTLFAVSGAGTQQAVTATFVADIRTAIIKHIEIIKNDADADGRDQNIVVVTVVDAKGNAVAGAPVSVVAPAPAKYRTQPENGKTDSQGKLIVTLNSTRAGTDNYIFGINNDQKTASLTFKATAAVASSAAINTERESYGAGEEMRVTVILRDAQGNAVSGQSDKLTGNTVTVPNTAPHSGNWTDNSDGSYTSMYTANVIGTGLKAVLKLSDWTTDVTSPTYRVTAGQPIQSDAQIRTDKNTYPAGSDIQVSVSLKDGAGNPAAGYADLLNGSAVTVQNAVPKFGNWRDNNDGTYTAIYTANTTGTGLTATLHPDSWSVAVISSPYAITAGEPAQSGSQISTDNTSYTAGADMQVTVMLIDKQGNRVSGQAAELNADTVTVMNAGLKTVWQDNSDGTYTAHYTAEKTGSGLTATLTLSSWTSSAISQPYSIVAGNAEEGSGIITVDKTTYTAGTEILVKVALKDSQGNAVSGQAALLTTGMVTVPNATAKSGNWTDHNDGSYSAIYIAKTTGTGLTATLQLSGWSTGVVSSPYAITAGAAAQEYSSIDVDSGTYIAGSDIQVTVVLTDSEGNGAALTNSIVTVPNATIKSGSAWMDNGSGVYSNTYVANTTGAGLTATLTVNTWNSDVKSGVYTITAGAAMEGKSTIAVDNISYVAGGDITVTVKLTDKEGNAALGQSAVLTESSVSVPNATQKPSNAWTDNGDGTYRNLYVANITGTGLTATLKLNIWGSQVSSGAYAITAGAATEGQSTIAVDNSTYAAGSDMTVTVTLTDKEGNAALGQSAVLTETTVTVANATQKPGNAWVDNGDGTYRNLYVANIAGTGLTATLKLGAWGSQVNSGSYAITAGTAVEGQSTIVVDNSTYEAGSDITVTVALTDKEGNAVSGQSATLTESTVSVPNATQKQGNAWVDNGDGTYRNRYVANIAGTGLTATLKLNLWGLQVSSGAYAITAGAATEGQSAIVVDNSTYEAGSDITVTVTLTDKEGNAALGQSAVLTESTVSVANATQKQGKIWVDNGDGTYRNLYVANIAGTGLTATLKLGAWGSQVNSGSYAITAGTAVEGQSTIVVDNSTYEAGSDITVTIALTDKEGNAVSGQSATLTESTVSVPNATQKQGNAWVDNGDGTYRNFYVANIAGTGLTATLKLNTWGSQVNSGSYAITAGAATEGQSAIVVDNSSYVAGSDMTVTVTLTDKEGNAALGQSAALIESTVTVPNAALKPGNAWVDNGDGTYRNLYVANIAGTALTATLKLSGWGSHVNSEAYAITVGSVSGEKSAFTSSKNLLVGSVRYMDGDISTQLTFTARDDYGNLISGASDSIKFNVKDSNSKGIKDGTDVIFDTITEDAQGIYTVNMHFNEEQAPDLYTVEPQYSGTNIQPLNAVITLKPSIPDYVYNGQYDIPSTLEVTPDSFKGDGITKATVTQTLVDKHNNRVVGVTRGVTLIVTQNLMAPAEGAVLTPLTDNGDGTYTGSLTGTIPGRYAIYGSYLDSFEARFTVTPDEPVQAQSTIAVDNTNYFIGDDVSVTVTLKNKQGKLLIGHAELLTDETVTVPKTKLVHDSQWLDNNDGTYTRVYMASSAGDKLVASLKLVGWSTGRASNQYVVLSNIKGIFVNNYSFNPEVGFPTTGFDKAMFHINVRTGQPSDYIWSSNADWVSVENGKVTFISVGNSNTVTISATPISGNGQPIEYSFAIKRWFFAGETKLTLFTEHQQYCKAQGGTTLPSGKDYTPPRNVGDLYPEWGDATKYTGSSFLVQSSYVTSRSGKPSSARGSSYILSIGQSNSMTCSGSGSSCLNISDSDAIPGCVKNL